MKFVISRFFLNIIKIEELGKIIKTLDEGVDGQRDEHRDEERQERRAIQGVGVELNCPPTISFPSG